jgi:hypothetical protein
LGPADESGAQSVALDITTDANEVPRFFDEMCLEPSLIDRTFTNIFSIESQAHGVGSRYPMEQG